RSGHRRRCTRDSCKLVRAYVRSKEGAVYCQDVGSDTNPSTHIVDGLQTRTVITCCRILVQRIHCKRIIIRVCFRLPLSKRGNVSITVSEEIVSAGTININIVVIREYFAGCSTDIDTVFLSRASSTNGNDVIYELDAHSSIHLVKTS